MKKILLLLLICIMTASLGACKKSADTAPSAAPQKTANTASPKPTLAPESTGQISSLIEKAPVPAEDEIPDTQTTSVEKNFSGDWTAYSSTSTNSSLESIVLNITYEGYTVRMSFDGSFQDTEYSGTYKIKDGVLKFDDNFKDCTAYFYEGDNETLVLDNGISLVYCKRAETEETMK